MPIRSEKSLRAAVGPSGSLLFRHHYHQPVPLSAERSCHRLGTGAVKAPGGSEVDVQRQVDTQNRTVVYAYAAPSGGVSDRDREWLKNVGWCHGVPATMTAPPVRVEE
jgi:hypothetical protein